MRLSGKLTRNVLLEHQNLESFNVLAPAPQHSRSIFRRDSESALGVISDQLAKRLAGLQPSAAFNRLSISARLILLVLALALPLNLIILGAIWGLINKANDAQRASLLYSARSIAAGVDAELGKHIALAEVLARSEELYIGYRKYQSRISDRRLRVFVLERSAA